MNRTFSLCLAAVLVTGSALAQTAQPAPQPPPKPKAGTIIDRPDSGKITSEPAAAPAPAPATPRAGTAQAGQRIERFEAVGNTSVASDTIRVYLGVNPGDPYDPA